MQAIWQVVLGRTHSDAEGSSIADTEQPDPTYLGWEACHGTGCHVLQQVCRAHAEPAVLLTVHAQQQGALRKLVSVVCLQ